MGLRNVDLEDASPSIPLFSLASILSMLFLFLTLLSLSLPLSFSFLSPIQNTSISRGIFRVVKKKKKTREQKSLEQLLKKIKWSHFRYFFEI